MDSSQAQPAVADQDQEILELLYEIDEHATRQGDRWAEKRVHARRPVRIPCEIRFIGPDGEAVVYTLGKTREISAGGMSFVSREHFARRAPVLITLSVIAGRTRFLPANVIYSRSVREGWYLTGVQFGPSSDARLTPEAHGEISARESRPAGQPALDENDDPLTLRRRMLQILAIASVPGQRTKNLIAKVVMASMSSDHIVRRSAIPVLLSIGGTEGTLSLISMLRDSNPVIAGEAAEALGMLKTPQGLEPLKQLLLHGDDEVAIRAAEALARMSNWSGKRVILRLLIQEGPPSRRAARALGFLVGRDFHPSAEGVAEARVYARQHDL
jgi:hypothetical protein